MKTKSTQDSKSFIAYMPPSKKFEHVKYCHSNIVFANTQLFKNSKFQKNIELHERKKEFLLQNQKTTWCYIISVKQHASETVFKQFIQIISEAIAQCTKTKDYEVNIRQLYRHFRNKTFIP